MKNIYFVQPNAIYGEEKKSVYIPYATGCIAAYAFDNEAIRNEYRLGGFVYTRMTISDAIAQIQSPYIVAFSSSTWNTEYNLELAEQVKNTYPQCIVIFGGHNVTAGTGMLEKYPFIDILIHGEGEIIFKNILSALKDSQSLESVANISYRKDGVTCNTAKEDYSFIDFPSPYTSGIFDSILNDGYDFSVIFETNRGCPNRCAFCDWGKLRSKVRLFSWEKICAELNWFADRHIEYIYCADANFGLFDRDIKVIEEVLKLRDKTGYPQKFKVNFSKNRQEAVKAVSSLMSKSNLGKSQTLSFQSLNPQVLENIGRSNLNIEYFNQLVSHYNAEGIRTYSELILGLPGETKESFAEGINTLLAGGQHKTMNVYPCELLPNSLLGSEEYVEKFNIHCTNIPFLQYHCKENDDKSGITEFAVTITSTNSMSFDDVVESYFFSTTVQAMHMLGLTRYIAIYLYKEKNVSYKDFYLSLIDYAKHSSGFINETFMKTCDRIKKIYKGELPFAECDTRFGDITYEPDEILFMRCLYNHENFIEDLKKFVISLGFYSEETDRLIDFQYAIIRHPNRAVSEITSDYNFGSYFKDFFEGAEPQLKKEPTDISVFGADTMSWQDYGRFVIWYGRHNEKTVLLSEAYQKI